MKLAQEKEVEKYPWTPHAKSAGNDKVRTTEWHIPTLVDLVSKCVASHSTHIDSFGRLPDEVLHKLAAYFCSQKRFDGKALQLFTQDEAMMDLRIPDCSLLEESIFLQCLQKEIVQEEVQHPAFLLPTLRHLELGFSGRCISDRIVHALGPSWSSLTTLKLNGCYRLTDTGIENVFHQCQQLHVFHISCNQKISKRSIDAICTAPYLVDVAIEDCPHLVEKDLESLTTLLPQLQSLSLVQLPHFSDNLLLQCSTATLLSLQHLRLSNCPNITPSVLSTFLSKCLHVESIDLSNMPEAVNDATLSSLSACTSLKSLSLRGCTAVTDTGLAYITTCELRHLNVSHLSGVSNASLESLLQNSLELESLNVSFCRGVTDAGLGRLTDTCVGLKELTLWGCTQVSIM